MYWYVQVCTSTYQVRNGMIQTSLYKYVLLNSGMYYYVYLWVEAMKVPLWKLEGVASGTHYAPELLRLPLNTDNCCQGTIYNMSLQNMIQLS